LFNLHVLNTEIFTLKAYNSEKATDDRNILGCESRVPGTWYYRFMKKTGWKSHATVPLRMYRSIEATLAKVVGSWWQHWSRWSRCWTCRHQLFAAILWDPHYIGTGTVSC